MIFQTFRQNLISNILFLLLFCVCLLLAPIIFFSWDLDWAVWTFMIPIILIVIAGGSIFGFLSKNKVFAVVLGFIIPVCFSMFFWQMRAFVYFLIPGILCAIAGGLMASENEKKYLKYIQYLVATVLLIFTIYLIDSILYLLYTS